MDANTNAGEVTKDPLEAHLGQAIARLRTMMKGLESLASISASPSAIETSAFRQSVGLELIRLMSRDIERAQREVATLALAIQESGVSVRQVALAQRVSPSTAHARMQAARDEAARHD